MSGATPAVSAQPAAGQAPGAQSTAAAPARPTRPLVTLIRREFWEHPALWLAPLAVAALLLLGALVGTVYLDTGLAPTLGQRQALFGIVAIGFNFPEFLTLGIITSIYAADCLYTERKDRSILFWKSMPVSDTLTVLAKVLVVMVIVPLGVYVLTCVTSLLASGLYALRSFGGQVPASIWDTGIWLRVQAVSLVVVVASGLWYAPLTAYVLMVSAWARRSVWMWLLLPPVVLTVLEQLVFGTHRVWDVVRYRLGLPLHQLRVSGGWTAAAGASPDPRPGADPSAVMNHAFAAVTSLDPRPLLSNPDLWLGLVAAVLFIAAAIRIRQYRDDT